jgi:hypothetical protein
MGTQVRGAATDVLRAQDITKQSLVGGRRTSLMACSERCVEQEFRRRLWERLRGRVYCTVDMAAVLLALAAGCLGLREPCDGRRKANVGQPSCGPHKHGMFGVHRDPSVYGNHSWELVCVWKTKMRFC